MTQLLGEAARLAKEEALQVPEEHLEDDVQEAPSSANLANVYLLEYAYNI